MTYTHKCSSYRDCPFNKCSILCTEKKGHSKSAVHVYMYTSDPDEEVSNIDLFDTSSLDESSSNSCTREDKMVLCVCVELKGELTGETAQCS